MARRLLALGTWLQLALAVLLVSMVFYVLAVVVGCGANAVQQADLAIAHGEAKLQEVRDDIDRLEERIDAEAPGNADALALLDDLRDTLAEGEALLEQAKEYRETLVNEEGEIDIGAAGAVAAGALPPPWNLIALIGLPLVTGVAENLRNKGARKRASAFGDVVHAIDATRSTDDALNKAIAGSALSANMPAATAALIRSTRKTHGSLP